MYPKVSRLIQRVDWRALRWACNSKSAEEHIFQVDIYNSNIYEESGLELGGGDVQRRAFTLRTVGHICQLIYSWVKYLSRLVKK